MRHETDPKPTANDSLKNAMTLDGSNPLLSALLSPTAREAFVYLPSEEEALLLGEEKERKRWGKPDESSDERAARIEAQREKTEETYRKVQTGIEDLAASLAAGKSETLLALLDAVSRFQASDNHRNGKH